MKKIILIICLMFCIIVPVYAKENKLYFTESDDRIYYDGQLFDEDVFMKHIDMLPGDKYTDELIIENGTKTTYKLYFKVDPKDNGEESLEFLENIYMKISLDGETIYEGNTTGINNTDDSINLQNAILLGEFTPSRTSKLVVETKLSEDYDNVDYNDFSYVDWSFYAQYDDEEPHETIVSPDTMKNDFPFTLIISVLVICIGIGFVIYAKKEEK